MADFKRVALWEIAKTQSGWTPSRANSKLWWWNIIRLKSWELNDNTNITEYSETITQAWIENSSAKLFPKWTLLIAMYGATAGKLGILWVDASTNQAICSIQNIKWLFDSKYLFYVLLHKRDQIVKDSFWWAQPNISKTYLDNFQIPLPPLEEQKKIVAYLDELNATISKLKSEYQSQLAMLDEMRNSSLDLVFWGSRERAYNLNNWKWVKLGEVCEIIWWGTPKTDVLEYRNNGTIRRATPTDLGKVWEIISISTTEKYITELGLKSSSAKILPKGAVLFSSRASIGKIAISETELSTNQWFANFVCGENIQNTFLAYVLLYFTENIVVLSNSTTFKEVSKWSLKEFEIPLPDLETQSQIVSYLDQVHQQITMLKTQVNSQIEHCDELWQSSLEKVLTQGVEEDLKSDFSFLSSCKS